MADASVDAFILHNEREESIPSIVEQLESLRVRTHYFQRDVPIGDDWRQVETARMEGARVVLVFLGDAGWGPTQSEYMEFVLERGKRLLPVLIGSPPPGDMERFGGLFQRLRYADLRDVTPAAIEDLVRWINDPDAPRSDGDHRRIVQDLIDGNEKQRADAIGQIQSRQNLKRAVLAAELREFVDNPSSIGRESSKIPSIRSWMLSALVWADPEEPATRKMLLDRLHPSGEEDASTRFWILAGLFQRGVSYLKSAVEWASQDPAPEVSLLARVIANPDSQEHVMQMRERLKETRFKSIWTVLRVLRVAAVPQLVENVCSLLGKEFDGESITYDAIYALAQQEMAPHAVPVLTRDYSIDNIVEVVLGVAYDASPNTLWNFSGLLAAFPAPDMDEALQRAGRRPGWRQLANDFRNAIARRLQLDSGLVWMPQYANDTIDVKNDYLDIREDVRTLAAVMVAKDVAPPLAIGLFGDWGSGKSYFMQSIKDAIGKLEDERKPQFCRNVVTVEFNAWNYIDTNLWASLATHILEELTAHVVPKPSNDEQRAVVTAELADAKTVAGEVREEQRKQQEILDARQKRLLELQQERQQKEIKLTDLRLSDFHQLLEANPDLKRKIEKSLANLGIPVAATSLLNLTQAVQEANSLRGKVAALASSLFRGQNGWLVAGLVAVALLIPVGFAWLEANGALKALEARAGLIVTEVAALATGIATILKNVTSHVSRNLAVVEEATMQVSKLLDEKRAQKTQEEADLEQDIATLKGKEQETEVRLASATSRVVELEEKIVALQKGVSLAHFLSERSQSDDYRKHLGLISTIRKDFKHLEDRLKQTITAPGEVPVDRIILYIDDLDRCPVEKVMEVLQAIHLLLAYPLFVVVVGVDPRWLLHSLQVEFSAFRSSENAKEGSEEWRTTPQNYLEKIFQIPFTLKPMSRGGYENLIGSLMGHANQPPQEEAPQVKVEPPAPHSSRKGKGRKRKPEAIPSQADSIAAVSTHQAGAQSDPPEAGPLPIEISEEALVIQRWEADFADGLFELIPNPRAVKRFSNIYRILKAPVRRADLSAFEGTQGMPGEFQVPMLLLAILIGRPHLALPSFRLLYGHAAGGGDVRHVFQTFKLQGPPLPEADDLAEVLRTIAADPAFPTDSRLFRYWIPRVSRFSFEVGHVILAEADTSPLEPSPSSNGQQATAATAL